jgi:cell division protein FtsL
LVTVFLFFFFCSVGHATTTTYATHPNRGLCLSTHRQLLSSSAGPDTSSSHLLLATTQQQLLLWIMLIITTILSMCLMVSTRPLRTTDDTTVALTGNRLDEAMVSLHSNNWLISSILYL